MVIKVIVQISRAFQKLSSNQKVFVMLSNWDAAKCFDFDKKLTTSSSLSKLCGLSKNDEVLAVGTSALSVNSHY